MNSLKTPKPLLVARMAFPLAASLITVLLGEWIARGALTADTVTSFIFPHAEAYLLAWLFLFLVWLLLDWIFRLPPLSTLGMAVLGCVPCAVNFYTLQLRGEPFLPWDLAQVSEAAGVASAAGIKIQTSMIVTVVVELALMAGSFFLYRGRHKQRWLPRVAGSAATAAALCLLIFGVYLQPAVCQAVGIVADPWMQDRYYRYYGVVTGFMTNLSNLEIDKPDSYSEEAVDAILDNVDESQKFSTSPLYPTSYAATTAKDEQVKKPTIIYVMNESYWDVSELEQYGIKFDTDVSANLHALQQTSAYGRAYSPSFGGGTCDVEFEALTGYSASFLPSGSKPYQQHVTKPMFALPSYLKTQGYQTAAVHCFWARYWSRDTAYPNLGLDDYLFTDNYYYQFIQEGEDVAYDDVFFPDLEARLTEYFATNEEYIRKYRFANAFHPFHGFSMMSCGHLAEEHTSAIYIVGAREPGIARGMGLKTRATFEEALADAMRKYTGPNPNILALPRTFTTAAVHLCMKDPALNSAHVGGAPCGG